ncbi:c-type cytochrome [Moheibacter lacus]|uniref:Cytochrome c n=1 Tax=Moheibacter lacus TaxID=2745851 RepID=A0A838ZIK1_9FLAO|nr:cytochrome c [Moheibacter lacus]MBA5628184.1 cytochrome c [Moheibacter lacus]
MKTIFQTFGFVIASLFVVTCATKAVTVASAETAPTKEFVKANFTEDQLAQGKTHFENNCAQCHKLFDPNSRNAEKWNNVLKRMLPKTDLRYEDGRLVQAYLVANSE